MSDNTQNATTADNAAAETAVLATEAAKLADAVKIDAAEVEPLASDLGKRLLADLVALEAEAKAAGHSIVNVLRRAAQDAGIISR